MIYFPITILLIIIIVFLFGIYANKKSYKMVNTDFPEWGVKILNHLKTIVGTNDDIFVSVYGFLNKNDVSGLREYLQDLYDNGKKYGLSTLMRMSIDWYISLLPGNKFTVETYVNGDGIVSSNNLN